MGEMLNNYIEDERNYALDGAVIRCDQMSDKAVFIQFTENGSKIRLEGSVGTITSEYTKPAGIGPERYNPEFEECVIVSHVGEENIRKLHAVSGNSQTDNGIRFATVIDRSYLREEEEKFGPKSDKCAKSKKKEIKFVDARVKNECAADKEHHRPIKFSTTEGEKEGLTMMSTLLCGKEGIITIEASGQIYIEPKAEDIEARIEELTSSITGKAVTSVEEIVNLSSVEVLARVIYQEQSYEGERAGQNAVMFSIFNRLFIGNVTRSIKENNHIYSIITASGQYDSIMNDRGNYPNAYQPPSGDSAEWENAKRLAAILYIAMEEYGHNVYDSEANITGSTKDGIILYDRNENVVDIDDLETREAMVDFIEEQCDIDGNKIINEIGTRGNIVTNHGTTPKHSGGK